MWQAFEGGQIWGGLTDFTGMHPPLWHLLHSFLEWAAPIPMLLIGTSLIFSIGAAWIASRLGWMVGLLVATSPLQLAYAAELNNYPAYALCAAWLWWSHQQAQSDGKSHHLVIATAVGVWVHLLLGAIGLLLAASLSRTVFFRVTRWLSFALLPLLPGLLELFQSGQAMSQPPFKPTLVASEYAGRFGLLSLFLLVPAWKGLRSSPHLAKAFLSVVTLILGLQVAGFAAPHQFPYWLALSVPFALLVQRGATTPLLRILVWSIAALQAISIARLNMSQVAEMGEDLQRTRGIDIALQEAQPGDGIYLLRKRMLPDDDKRGFSSQLARISPWNSLPRTRPYNFPYVDHRHGQPRDLNGVAVYVNDNPREVIQEAIAAHGTLFLVVSGHHGNRRFAAELTQWVHAEPEEIGEDSLYRLQSGN